jgi:3-oxoacyl-[acyl-carrier protein] reductase
VLKDKVAIVTGGGRGIGQHICLNLAANQAKVCVFGRTQETLDATVTLIREKGGKAYAYVGDVQNPEQVQAVTKDIIDKHGRIDILCNNAGVTRDNLLIRMKDEEWDAVLGTNLKGAFYFTRAVLKPMMKQRSGRIVNVTSVIGLIGNAGQSNYAASKSGLIGFTKSIAREVASRGILVNAIAPGFIETDMTDVLDEKAREILKKEIPLGFFGTADDVANAAWFLCSDLSRYITGQVLTIDGGMVM